MVDQHKDYKKRAFIAWDPESVESGGGPDSGDEGGDDDPIESGDDFEDAGSDAGEEV